MVTTECAYPAIPYRKSRRCGTPRAGVHIHNVVDVISGKPEPPGRGIEVFYGTLEQKDDIIIRYTTQVEHRLPWPGHHRQRAVGPDTSRPARRGSQSDVPE